MTMSKKEFATRMALFSLFACIIPFGFIIYRYDLFKRVDKIAMSGWGLISLIIILIFAFYVVKTLKRCLNNTGKWSMGMQVFNGFVKVLLPLVALYFVVVTIEAKIDFFKQSLVVLILCEGVAIPINPLPQLERHTEKVKIASVGMLLKKGSEK